MKLRRDPSNARVTSNGNWSAVRPGCHPESHLKMSHSTAFGIYEVQCATCSRVVLRVEVGVGR
jgi:hypothetical protein